MRTLLLAILSCLLTSAVNAQGFRTLHLFEAVPPAIKALSDTEYKNWALYNNMIAYEQAEDRANGFKVQETVRIDNGFSEWNNHNEQNIFQFGQTPRRRNWSRGNRRSITTTFSQDRWGGGPILLVNPYCRD